MTQIDSIRLVFGYRPANHPNVAIRLNSLAVLSVDLQQHSWPAPSVLWKLFEYGHTFLRLGPCTGCV